MNRKRIAQYCCAALVAAGIGLNIQNAIADYGIGENSLSLVAGPGSNSGSNSNSNSNWDSNWDTSPEPDKTRYDCQDVIGLIDPDEELKQVLDGETPPANGHYEGDIMDENNKKIGEWYTVDIERVYGCNICQIKNDGQYTDWKCENKCKGPFSFKRYV